MSDNSVGKIFIDLVLNSSDFQKQTEGVVKKTMNNVQKSVTGTLKSIGRTALTFLSAKALVDFSKSCIELGSDLQEVQNVVDVTFGSMSADVEKFADTAIKSFGLSEKVAKEYMGNFGTMAKQFGYTTEEAFEMSKTLTGLVGDVSSFRNLSSDQSYTKLKAVFTGETESLKELGVVMTQSALNQYSMTKGSGKLISKMTEQEKVTLRYNFVLDQLKSNMGDFIRTQNGWANQTRILSLQFDSLKANIGQGMIAVLTPVIQYINLLMEKLVQLTDKFKTFTESIFGTSSTTSTIASDMDNLAIGTAGVGDAAEKTAKQINKSLMPFDKLNLLRAPISADVSGGGGGSGISSNESSQNTPNQDGVKKTFSEWFKETFGDVEGLGEWINAKLTGMMEKINWEKIYEKAREFGTGFAKFLNGLISPELFSATGKTIANSLNTAIYTAGSFIKTFDWAEWGESIGAGINSFVENFDWTEFGKTVNELIQGIKTALFTAIEKINWKEVWEGAKKTLGEIEIDTWAFIIGAVTISSVGKWIFGGAALALLKTSFGSLLGKAFTNLFGEKTLLGTILGGLTKLFKGIFGETGVIALVTGGAGTLGEAFSAVFGSAATNVTGVGAIATGAITAILSFWDMLKNGFSWVKEALMLLGTAIAAVGAVILGAPAMVAAVVAGIVAAVATLIVVIKDNFEAIKKFFVDLGTKIGEFFSGIADSVSKWWNEKAVPFFDTVFTKVSEFINNIVTKVQEWFANIKTFFEDIGKFIKDFFTGIGEAISTWWKEKVVPFFEGIKTTITDLVEKIKEKISDFINKIKENISNFGKNLKEAISNFVENIKEKVSKFVDKIKETIGNGLKNLKEKVFEFGGKIKEKITSFGENLKKTAEDVVENIKEKVVAGLEKMVDLAKRPVNAIIRMINNMIDGINSISIDIPDWVPGKYGGKSIGFSIPHIPELATGGFVERNTPRPVIVGDNKREGEIIAPESKIREQVDIANKPILSLLQQLVTVMQNGNSKSGDIVIPISLGNEVLDTYIVSAEKRQIIRTGGR